MSASRTYPAGWKPEGAKLRPLILPTERTMREGEFSVEWRTYTDAERIAELGVSAAAQLCFVLEPIFYVHVTVCRPADIPEAIKDFQELSRLPLGPKALASIKTRLERAFQEHAD